VCFDYDTANTLLWALSSELVSYTEGYLGSAYELPNKNILVATPSTSSTKLGKMMVIKRSSNSDFPIVTIDLDGDGIYAMPTELSSEYYVVVDDRFNAGKNSKLVRYNSSGKVIKSWNNKNLLKHPKGLNVLPNGDVLISE
jgi:3-dehydroquinate synthase class II